MRPSLRPAEARGASHRLVRPRPGEHGRRQRSRHPRRRPVPDRGCMTRSTARPRPGPPPAATTPSPLGRGRPVDATARRATATGQPARHRAGRRAAGPHPPGGSPGAADWSAPRWRWAPASWWPAWPRRCARRSRRWPPRSSTGPPPGRAVRHRDLRHQRQAGPDRRHARHHRRPGRGVRQRRPPPAARRHGRLRLLRAARRAGVDRRPSAPAASPRFPAWLRASPAPPPCAC